MKIERISENQIRCTLNKEDLDEKEVLLTELAYGTEKAKALFRELMQQASEELGFEVDDSPLMIEAIPVSRECLILVITKVDNPDELDTRFSRFSGSAKKRDFDDDLDDEDEYDDEFDDLDDELSNVKERRKSDEDAIDEITGHAELDDKELDEIMGGKMDNLMRLFDMLAKKIISDDADVEVLGKEIRDNLSEAQEAKDSDSDSDSDSDKEATNSEESNSDNSKASKTGASKSIEAGKSKEHEEKPFDSVRNFGEKPFRNESQALSFDVYTFKSLSQLIKVASIVKPFIGNLNNTIYKKETIDKKEYLLVINRGPVDQQYLRVRHIIIEYGNQLKVAYSAKAYYEEYCKVIAENDALQKLASL